MTSKSLSANWPRIFPGKANLSFTKPKWIPHAGAAGAYVSESSNGEFEAIAEPISTGWCFWLVPFNDPENSICMEDKCAS